VSWERPVTVTREKRNTHGVLMGKLKLRDLLEDPGIGRSVILHWVSKRLVWRNGLISLGPRKSGGLLWTWQWNYGVHTTRKISWPADGI